MWIALRLAVIVVAFIARYVTLWYRPGSEGTHGGLPWYQKLEKTKKGDIVSFEVGVEMRAKVLFRLQREEASDRWFKSMGLAEEFQTGDAKFDNMVYVACDHPALHRALKDNRKAREKIEEMLEAGYSRIWSDGNALWTKRLSKTPPGPKDLDRLAALHAALGGMKTGWRFFSDPYNARVVAVEALTWSLFGYALAGFIEYWFEGSYVHMDPYSLLVPGAVATVVLVAGLLAVVWWLLKGSSRGHRILVEGVVLIALSAPVAGIQVVSDVNRSLDRSPPTASSWTVVNKYSVRKRRTPTRYYLVLGSRLGGAEVDVPSEVQVESSVYNAATRGKGVEIDVGRGALGYRWYRRITPL